MVIDKGKETSDFDGGDDDEDADADDGGDDDDAGGDEGVISWNRSRVAEKIGMMGEILE